MSCRSGLIFRPVGLLGVMDFDSSGFSFLLFSSLSSLFLLVFCGASREIPPARLPFLNHFHSSAQSILIHLRPLMIWTTYMEIFGLRFWGLGVDTVSWTGEFMEILHAYLHSTFALCFSFPLLLLI